MNTTLVLALKIVAVFIVVPYLLSQIARLVLEQADPTPPRVAADKAGARGTEQPQSMKQQLDRIQREGADAQARLSSVRAKTRIILIVVAVYYVLAAATWIVVWRRNRGRPQPQAGP